MELIGDSLQQLTKPKAGFVVGGDVDPGAAARP
jgi:hypothetical protein